MAQNVSREGKGIYFGALREASFRVLLVERCQSRGTDPSPCALSMPAQTYRSVEKEGPFVQDTT